MWQIARQPRSKQNTLVRTIFTVFKLVSRGEKRNHFPTDWFLWQLLNFLYWKTLDLDCLNETTPPNRIETLNHWLQRTFRICEFQFRFRLHVRIDWTPSKCLELIKKRRITFSSSHFIRLNCLSTEASSVNKHNKRVSCSLVTHFYRLRALSNKSLHETPKDDNYMWRQSSWIFLIQCDFDIHSVSVTRFNFSRLIQFQETTFSVYFFSHSGPL